MVVSLRSICPEMVMEIEACTVKGNEANVLTRGGTRPNHEIMLSFTRSCYEEIHWSFVRSV